MKVIIGLKLIIDNRLMNPVSIFLILDFLLNIGDAEIILHLPTLIQEIVLAVWLLIKGYTIKAN